MSEFKFQQKSRHLTVIKRQANQGLEGILREGRGRGTSPSLIKKETEIFFMTIKVDQHFSLQRPAFMI